MEAAAAAAAAEEEEAEQEVVEEVELSKPPLKGASENQINDSV